jgi:hypothetical protein
MRRKRKRWKARTKREEDPPDTVGKQNRGREGVLLQSPQVMTFFQ